MPGRPLPSDDVENADQACALLPDRDHLESNLAALYDQQAPRRPERGSGGLWREAARDAFFAQLRSEGRTTLVEAGTGTGHDAAAFQAAGLTVAGIDLSPSASGAALMTR